MTTSSPLPPADRDAAATWVARMDDPATWSAADEAALQAWLAADPRRHGLLLQVQAAWELPGAVTPPAAPEAVDSAPGDDAIEPANDRGAWARRGVLGGLVAAGIAGAAATRLVLANGAQYVTRLGEIRRVPLDDGSVMTINSDTALKVNLGQHAREVELDQGEAWFEVAKDAKRPFVVASGPVRAQAIGTAFSVRKREEGVEILVTEGVVETWSAADATQRLRVVAGERAMVNARALVHYQASETAPVDRALAWRNGMIDLNGTTLREAADEFNRYNQRQIVIADPEVAAEQFDGLFRIGDPDGFAQTLKATLAVKIDVSDPRTIRIERAAETGF
ncbi:MULTISPECIES: FecR domain-containing protein [unclassified Novosphingobium]|uniref:FecR family protein n=1 Tax=unclassified Novosphingobium TaxID=2644732 RepID=UPI000D302BAC|nr:MULTISPECIES: FecR domain-containing protein [unclassified Novosphingobium]PTR12032.1 FecR family protein [Novosphingobium sp. GV055]PUB05072.1 FecR family protein [Novosphingobium sp. GV061]PUB21391.1 FecR family protein [Novosphingobium sp. GV079]PUB43117.1 FecR family protein [Novosphingobium sp. GV027]